MPVIEANITGTSGPTGTVPQCLAPIQKPAQFPVPVARPCSRNFLQQCLTPAPAQVSVPVAHAPAQIPQVPIPAQVPQVPVPAQIPVPVPVANAPAQVTVQVVPRQSIISTAMLNKYKNSHAIIEKNKKQ